MNLYDQGRAAFERKDYAQAIAWFTEAIRLAPAHFDANVWRGVVHFEIGEIDQAIAAFTVALRLQPAAPVYFNRGMAFERKRRRSWVRTR